MLKFYNFYAAENVFAEGAHIQHTLVLMKQILEEIYKLLHSASSKDIQLPFQSNEKVYITRVMWRLIGWIHVVEPK